MKRALAMLLLLLAAGCSAPRAGVAVDARAGGVSVSPSVTGNLGGLTVSVRG